MPLVKGMGPCQIPKDDGMPCGNQIGEGEPIGSVITPLMGSTIGHRKCAQEFHERKQRKEAQARRDAMVKRVDQDQAGGSINWASERDGIGGSIPLERSPNKTDLNEAVHPISSVPMDASPAQATELAIDTPPVPADKPNFTEYKPPGVPLLPIQGPQLKVDPPVHELPLIPANGFMPNDFPQVMVVNIPYISGHAHEPRPDPAMSINDEGWMLIETGTVRFALPDREEWRKLTLMGEALWNSHELKLDEEKRDSTPPTE